MGELGGVKGCVEGGFDGGSVGERGDVWTEGTRLGGGDASETGRSGDGWQCFVEGRTEGRVYEGSVRGGRMGRNTVRRGRVDEFVGGEKVSLRDVTDIGVVKEVVIVSDLEMCLAALVDLVETHHHLTVSGARMKGSHEYSMERKSDLPEDAGRPDCDRQKAALAVGFENERLAFGFRVVVGVERLFWVGCAFVEVDDVFSVEGNAS